MSTEYEQLLAKLLEERKTELSKLDSVKGKEKQADELRAEMRYIEFEIEHYQKGLALFRSKSNTKVGRWGRPEKEEHSASPPS